MSYIIQNSYIDINNYSTIVATINLLDNSNTVTGSVSVNIPPVFVTPYGWKNATITSNNTAYENELITMYSNNWSDSIIVEYKNNNQPLLDGLSINTIGYLTIEELDSLLNDLLNE